MGSGDAAGAGHRPEPVDRSKAPKTPSRQVRNRMRTRKRIMDAAIELFTRQGYEKTTIQEIADAADIAVRTFYYHFDSKAGLAMAWFTDWSDDLEAAVDAQPPSASPADLLMGALASLVAKGYPGGMAWADAEGRPSVPPQVQALLQVSDPAFAGVVYQRLVAGYRRLAGVLRARLGYADDAWEPYAITGALLSLWFVGVHGSQDMIARGFAAPPAQVSVQRALTAYSQGLEQLWVDRPTAS